MTNNEELATAISAVFTRLQNTGPASPAHKPTLELYEALMQEQALRATRAENTKRELADCRDTLKDERYCHGQTIADLQRAASEMLGMVNQRAENTKRELDDKELDRQYHMNAINKLARFLSLTGTSDAIVQAAMDNMTRMAEAARQGKGEGNG